MEKIRNFIKTHVIWIFLILAPVTSAIFVYGRYLNIVPGRLYLHGRFFTLFFLLIFLVKFTRGVDGLKNIFKPMLNWKISIKWYVFAISFAISIACLTLFLKGIYFGGDFSMFKLNLTAVSIPAFTFNMILFAFMGEVVWVSFSVRELSKIMSTFFASQIVGLVWGLWWVPIVIFNDAVVENLPIFALIINMMGAAGICAIVYKQTKSGVCVWVLQIMLNTAIVVFPVSPATGIPTYWAFSIVYFIVMVVLSYYFKTMKRDAEIKPNFV